MPSRNVQRNFRPNSYYHVYNRGVEKREIFLDEQDRRVFLGLFGRYLDPDHKESDSSKIDYQDFSKMIEIQCYCLMDNHFHLLMWVGYDPRVISDLMRSLSNSYVSYFNKKYSRVGPLFQGKFKSNMVETEEQLIHTSRYIHLNPVNPMNYEYSSVSRFIGTNFRSVTWLNPRKLICSIGTLDYNNFLMEKYKEQKKYSNMSEM